MKFPPSRAVVCLGARGGRGRPVVRRPRGRAEAAARRRTNALSASGDAARGRHARCSFEGKFDDVDSAIAKLDTRDPDVVALKARAMIARGKYAEAEALLQPVAQRAPTSEAALQLGLLQKLLGRLAATADT